MLLIIKEIKNDNDISYISDWQRLKYLIKYTTGTLVQETEMRILLVRIKFGATI